MINDAVIKVQGLWKRYGLLRNTSDWALRDVNFQLEKGEMLGVVGRNGAGKSTLLKILAGVSPLTRGNIQVQGKIFPVIELNAGVHPELSGRENVHLLAAIMGLTKQETRRILPQVQDFCELADWFEQPVRKYSTGMLARLGFSVAASIKADILLIDEVLAVGDIAFQRKCIGWLNQARQDGTTIIFVSHNLNYVERLCTKALYLESGMVKAFGEVKDVCTQYYQQINDEIIQRLGVQSGLNTISRGGTKEMRITGIKVLDASGRETRKVFYESDLCIELKIETYQNIDNPCFTVIVVDQDMNPVGHATTLGNKNLYQHFSAGAAFTVVCRLRGLNLLRSVYTIDAGIGNQEGSYKIDVVSNLAQFEVVYSDDKYTTVSVGHIMLPADWQIKD